MTRRELLAIAAAVPTIRAASVAAPPVAVARCESYDEDITAILSKQPQALSSIQSGALQHIIERCLEKDPDRRWQSAREPFCSRTST